MKAQDYKDEGDVDVGNNTPPETDFNSANREDVFSSKKTSSNNNQAPDTTKTNTYYVGVRFS
eukprot:13734149-Alexandrium_andersonii.AAC.1